VIIIYRRIEDVKDTIVLFRPVYKEEGNVTEIFFAEEGRLKKACDRRSITTVRQALARTFNLDLSAQTKKLELKFNRKYLLPFYLPDGRVFVPFKMRRPVIVGDSTYGYAELGYIKAVRKLNGQTLLKLTTEDEIPLYSSSAAAYSYINLGKDTCEYLSDRIDDEQGKILDALGILINKLYRIEKILDKF